MQISDLVVKFNPDGRTAILVRPLFMKWTRDDGSFMSACVPTGFETDFASIPQAVRSLLPQLGRWTVPAVMHDWLYYTAPSYGMTQQDCDNAFNAMMKDANVVTWRRLAIYAALRSFGFVAFNNHRKAGHSLAQWEDMHK